MSTLYYEDRHWVVLRNIPCGFSLLYFASVFATCYYDLKKTDKWKKMCEAETPSSILFYTRIDDRVKFVWSLKQCVAVGSIHVENWIIWKQKGLGKRGGRLYNRVIEYKS